MGFRKPERRCFELVVEKVGLPVGAFCFLDDSPENIDGARAVGMPASLVRSYEDLAKIAARLM